MARKKKNPRPPGLGQGSGYYTQEIVKRLEQAFRYSGHRPYRLFDDWTLLVEACLEALPEQLKAVAQTGRFAPDTPETVELFNQIRARYEFPNHPEAHRQVWEAFAEAFAMLLESAEPGLWGEGSYGDFDCRVPKIMRRRRSKTAVLDKDSEIEAESGTKIMRPPHFSARGNETGRSGHNQIGPEIMRLAPNSTLDKDNEISFVTWYGQVGGLARP